MGATFDIAQSTCGLGTLQGLQHTLYCFIRPVGILTICQALSIPSPSLQNTYDKTLTKNAYGKKILATNWPENTYLRNWVVKTSNKTGPLPIITIEDIN